MTAAVGVGACNVEQADATSGVPSWQVVQERIASGWERIPALLPLPGWSWSEETCLWFGPAEAGRRQT